MRAKREGSKRQGVRSLFRDEEATELPRTFPSYPLELVSRVYTSRLIGRDEGLVLHGGGNTSVKLSLKSVVGEDQKVLFVKGSGGALGTIDPEGFTGLDLDALQKLRNLRSLSDEEMENQLLIHKISARSPDPSVEALLHAFLPHRYIDHTHAEAILILTNQRRGTDLLREALGPQVGILPYLASGFPLAKGVFDFYENSRDLEAIVVLNHGIFTFGDDARSSYERMIGYVSKAESYIRKKAKGKILTLSSKRVPPSRDPGAAVSRICQVLRGACAHRRPEGGLRRFYVEVRDRRDLKEISLSREAERICMSGVLTPDHVIWTKNHAVYIEDVPKDDDALKRMVHESVREYKASYEEYFRVQVAEKKVSRDPLDPYPRVFLVKGVGLIVLGFTRRAALIAADIAEHTLQAKVRARGLGEYVPISESHLFNMEYWSLQQKKLGRGSPPPLQGQIAVITGGAGAIGFGVADRLLDAGAAVVVCDVDGSRLKKVRTLLAAKHGETQIETMVFDVTDYLSVERGFTEIGRRLGGIDLLVPNAGIAHVATIEDLAPEKLDQVVAVNLKGTFNVIKASIPIFRRQGTGGSIVVISSKNVFDPGAAFGAYSASKAGAHQLSKIAALELAELGVRVNMVNPDAVFGDGRISSKLWDLVGAERMKSRGLDPEGLRRYYRERSLLKVPVTAEHVGNAVLFFATEQTPTTGATLPVDGGVPAAFPR
jgi:rhamnose utilization protein RhaD (predicted bifunctional aldolase and dehydrogenase)/NAD(P)-dependent dehydrogenase (short-subunit alcohol dehydrogenase family)